MRLRDRRRYGLMSAREIKLSIVQDTEVTRSFPWPAASATGIGSMPGHDPGWASAVVLEELPDLPYLTELPARGVGADMIGRTAALLLDMPVETTPGGWKLSTHESREQRRAAGFLSSDLDAAQEAAEGYEGPYKISVCGPLTMAAALELSRSLNPALADPGALADLTASLAEGIAAHVLTVKERIPGATVIVQVDEPALPKVLMGRIPTASRLSTVRPLDPIAASATLRAVLGATTAFTVLHCCAAEVPFLLMKEIGAGAVSFDLARLVRAELDAVAEIAEAGLGLLVGALPTMSDSSVAPRQPRETAEAVVRLWHRTSIDPARLAEQVVITPACGLAGLSPEAARAALAHCRDASRIAPELMEEVAR